MHETILVLSQDQFAEHLRKQLQGHAQALVHQLLPANALQPPPPEGADNAGDSDATEWSDPAPPGRVIPLSPTSDHEP